jgi:hypothetical protein
LSESSMARTATVIAAPTGGAQENSSSRIHCTRTGRPGILVATKAASKAASSAELWP